jgi:U3 small nucleolar RNA-associated protein 12
VTNVRTLKMIEDVLAVSISPQGKHIAVALLDCNVKVISNSLPHRHTQYVYFYMFLCNWKFGIILSHLYI